jgi:hypothetical protein
MICLDTCKSAFVFINEHNYKLNSLVMLVSVAKFLWEKIVFDHVPPIQLLCSVIDYAALPVVQPFAWKWFPHTKQET